jgi:hypothetical protein
MRPGSTRAGVRPGKREIGVNLQAEGAQPATVVRGAPGAGTGFGYRLGFDLSTP